MTDPSDPRRAVPEANPLNSHGPARMVYRAGIVWMWLLIALAWVFALGDFAAWQFWLVFACIAVTFCCLLVLRRL